MNYTAYNPENELIGQTVLAFVENTNAEAIRPFLERHGLTEVNPDEWYKLQTWLDVLSDLSTEAQSFMDFVSIGMSIAEHAVLPPHVERMTYAQFVQMIDKVYQMQHRNGYAGHEVVTLVDETHAVIDYYVPYPDNFLYGVAYGFARRFLPKETGFYVEFDRELPRREQGAEFTRLHVKWECPE